MNLLLKLALHLGGKQGHFSKTVFLLGLLVQTNGYYEGQIAMSFSFLSLFLLGTSSQK